MQSIGEEKQQSTHVEGHHPWSEKIFGKPSSTDLSQQACEQAKRAQELAAKAQLQAEEEMQAAVKALKIAEENKARAEEQSKKAQLLKQEAEEIATVSKKNSELMASQQAGTEESLMHKISSVFKKSPSKGELAAEEKGEQGEEPGAIEKTKSYLAGVFSPASEGEKGEKKGEKTSAAEGEKPAAAAGEAKPTGEEQSGILNKIKGVFKKSPSKENLEKEGAAGKEEGEKGAKEEGEKREKKAKELEEAMVESWGNVGPSFFTFFFFLVSHLLFCFVF